MENTLEVTSELTKRQLEIVDMLWDSLKHDPEHKDRRVTSWGTKTKLGLARSIERLFDSQEVH